MEQRGQPAADAGVAAHGRIGGVLLVHLVALGVGDHLEGQLVVVAQEEAPLAAVGQLRGLGEDGLDRAPFAPLGGEVHAGHEREVEAHVALVAAAEVGQHVARPLVGLGQQHAARVAGVQLGAQRLQEGVGLGQVLAVGAVGLVEVGHGVEAEAVEAEVGPVADHVDDGPPHLGVAVVEVGLVGEEAVPEVLLPHRVPGPVGALGVVEDDPGLGPPLVVVVPDVPVGLGVRPVLAALLEPRVLVAGVVRHQVGDDPDAPLVGLVDELDHVGQDAVAAGGPRRSR